MYRNPEKYSLPSAAFQYRNSINSPGSPMIEAEKPASTRNPVPRTFPSATPMAANSSQEVVFHEAPAPGAIWTPSSVAMTGTIVAVAL